MWRPANQSPTTVPSARTITTVTQKNGTDQIGPRLPMMNSSASGTPSAADAITSPSRRLCET